MKTIALLIASLISSEALSAQFYTIKPLERETFRIITRSNKSSSQDSLEATRIPARVAPKQQETTGNISLSPGFSLPLTSPIVVNSSFGYRSDPLTGKRRFHSGIDIRTNESTVFSMLGGKVKKTGYERKGLGNFVTLKHGDFEVTYGHLSSVFVSEKDKVDPGTPLGISGSTGRSTGDHLHLSLKLRGKKVNPLPFLLYIQKKATEKDIGKTT